MGPRWQSLGSRPGQSPAKAWSDPGQSQVKHAHPPHPARHARPRNSPRPSTPSTLANCWPTTAPPPSTGRRSSATPRSRPSSRTSRAWVGPWGGVERALWVSWGPRVCAAGLGLGRRGFGAHGWADAGVGATIAHCRERPQADPAPLIPLPQTKGCTFHLPDPSLPLAPPHQNQATSSSSSPWPASTRSTFRCSLLPRSTPAAA